MLTDLEKSTSSCNNVNKKIAIDDITSGNNRNLIQNSSNCPNTIGIKLKNQQTCISSSKMQINGLKANITSFTSDEKCLKAFEIVMNDNILLLFAKF